MNKVKFFRENAQFDLEREVTDFIKDKKVISISYSTNTVGYSIEHFCVVLYSA